MERDQESGMTNLCLLNVDADDATDIISSDSKVLREGLNVGEKGLRGEQGVTGNVIMGLPPMSLLVEALPAGKLLVSLPTYRQNHHIDGCSKCMSRTQTSTKVSNNPWVHGLVGASLSKPHTNVVNGAFSLIIILLSYTVDIPY